MIPGTTRSAAGSDTTNICVFDNCENCFFFKFTNQLNGRINIHQIIVRNFLTVQLPEYFLPVPFKICLLMWVLSITQVFDSFGSRNCFARVKIFMNGKVVAGNYFKGFRGELLSLFPRKCALLTD